MTTTEHELVEALYRVKGKAEIINGEIVPLEMSGYDPNFAVGTLDIWDMDLLAENVVRVFRNGDADRSASTYRRGQAADAEPAVPGWTMPVDDLFEA